MCVICIGYMCDLYVTYVFMFLYVGCWWLCVCCGCVIGVRFLYVLWVRDRCVIGV